MDRKFALFINHGQFENGNKFASLQCIDIRASKLQLAGRLGRQSATFKLAPSLVENFSKTDFPCLVDLELEFVTTSKGQTAHVVDARPVPFPKGKSFQEYLDSLIESVDSKDSKPSTFSTSSSTASSSSSASPSLSPLPSRT